jgi:hypothetical protein
MAQAATNVIAGNFGKPKPTFPVDDDEESYLPVEKLKRQYLDYVGAKVLEIEEMRTARHYYHGSQWTADEIKILRARRQPIITYNRINRKIDGIVGLCEKLRQDPKAFPRNPRNGSGAEVATQAIRTVLDEIDWRTLDHETTERAATDGIGGIELKLVNGDHDDPDVAGASVFTEDWFYDPRSRKADFSDAMYHGIAKWVDDQVAIELFPDFKDQIKAAMESGSFDYAHADQETKWIYSNEKRVRLVEHWYKHAGKWCWCFYIDNLKLDEGVSPFLDERGKPVSRFFMFSAAVDQDGDRYGFPRNLKGPQDEINQRRSKGLHISNSRRLIMEIGSVKDVETARKEWARPDGILEINPGFSDKIKPDDQTGDLKAAMDFLGEAKNEIDSFANVNPALLAQGDPSEHSGVAIDLIQRAGLAELSKFILAHRSWKIRVYRAIWNIVQRHWTAERWIRVTDDQKVASWIQLNGVDIDRNPQSPNFGKPVLVNALGSLDVDIIIDEGPDTANIMQDAYQLLRDDPSIPPIVKIELMPAPQGTKDRIKGLLQQAAQNQPPDPKLQVAQINAQTAKEKGQAEIQKANVAAQAETFNANQDAMQRQQDMQLEQMDANNRREEIQMEMQFKREQHADKMEEIRANALIRAAEHQQKIRELAARPKQTAQK